MILDRRIPIFLGTILFTLIVSLLLTTPSTLAANSTIRNVDLASARTFQLPTIESGLSFPTESSDSAEFVNCRYGVGVTSPTQSAWLESLNAGWYVRYVAHQNEFAHGSEYVRMFRLLQNRDASGNFLSTYEVHISPSFTDNTHYSPTQIQALIRANPGALWIIGNEPDVLHQDGIQAHVYAQAFYDVHHLIKATDPTAQTGTAALVQVTPNRLEWWQQFADAYAQISPSDPIIPVDVWNIHVYTMPEMHTNGVDQSVASIALGTSGANAMTAGGLTGAQCSNPDDTLWCFAEHDSVDIFESQLWRFRQWMKDQGQQNKPLIITEYSILYPYVENYQDSGSCGIKDENGQCFDPGRVTEYMRNTFDRLENASSSNVGHPGDNNRLVQQWNWFAVNYDAEGKVSSLLTDDYATYPAGDARGFTQVGNAFRSEVASRAVAPNLWVQSASAELISYNPATRRGSWELTATVWNNGNADIDDAFQISFYGNPALTNLIGTKTVSGSRGCARDGQTVTLTWSNVLLNSNNRKPFYVVIDAGQSIVESNEGDNQAVGYVFPVTDEYFMPISFK